jgi:outer membrane protein TolC
MKKLLISIIALSALFLNVARADTALGLTNIDLKIITVLTSTALENSSAVRAAKRELAAEKQAQSVLGTISNNTSVTVSASSGNLAQLPDGQVTPNFSVSVSVNLSGIINGASNKIPDLEAKLTEAENAVKKTVMDAYVSWWIAGETAEEDSQRLETAITELKQNEARFKAGTATAADLSSARDNVTRAKNQLRAANAEIVKTKYEILRICAITSDELTKIIKEANAK